MEEHTILSTDAKYSDIEVSEYDGTGNVNFQRTWSSGDVSENQGFFINGGEREALGRLLLNDVDGVSVLEENEPTPAQEAEDDGHDENQSLPDTRDKYDWFSPNAPNVTCLTDRDKYDVNKYIVEKERTCTLVEQIGHHYKHVQLHEKEVENLRELWDDSRPVDELFEDDESDSTCVCGNPSCETPIIPEDESDEITECLCGHDPHWEDHGLCPFEDSDGEDDDVLLEEVEREAEQLLAEMESTEDSEEDDGDEMEFDFESPTMGEVMEENQTADELDGDMATRDRNPCVASDSFPQCCEESKIPPQTPNASVVLETAVDVTEASDEQRDMYYDMALMVEQNFETFVNKNMSYGSSFLKTDVGQFDTELQANANGLLVRMFDKHERLNTLLFGGEDYVGETAVETALDLSNYALMMAYLVQERGEN